MVATTVVAHAGEEVLYVLVPFLVLYLGWRVWDRRWGKTSTEPGEDDAAPEPRATPPKGSHDR